MNGDVSAPRWSLAVRSRRTVEKVASVEAAVTAGGLRFVARASSTPGEIP